MDLDQRAGLRRDVGGSSGRIGAWGLGIWLRLAPYGFVLPVLLFAVVAWRYVTQNPLETDEGFYAAAARAAVSGLVPYRDFPFNQTHVFPYVHGALLSVSGFGLFAHRLICALYAAGSIAVIVRGRTFGHVFAATGLVVSALFISRSVLGQSFPLAALFLVGLGAAFVARKQRSWVIAVLGVLAIGSKLTVAPAVGILWLAHVWRARSLASVIAPVVAVVVVFVPVIAADPHAWWFWNVGYHLGLEGIDFRSTEAYRDHLLMAPSVLGLAALAIAVVGRRRRLSQASGGLTLIVAALLAWAIQLPLPSTQGEYAVLFLPLLALGTAEVLRFADWTKPMRVAVMAILVVGILTPAPARDPRVFEQLRAAAAALREQVPMTQQILTPVPIVAIESGHPLYPGCEMGPFHVTDELSQEEAARLHLLTPERIVAAAADPAVGAVVLTGQPSTWDFFWSVPSLNEIAPAKRASMFRAIADQAFHSVFQNAEFSVLVRKPEAGPVAPFWTE